MIQSIQPPVPPQNPVATTPVNTVVSIQAISSTTAIGEGSGGANPALAALAQGTTVQGFVVNRDAQSNPILRTAIGDLRVTSEVFLKTGSEVTIRVDNTAASLARIVAVDGLTPQDYNAQTQAAARGGITQDTISQSALQPLLANTQTTPTKAGAPAATNPVLQAVVLQGQPAATAPSLLTTALAASQSGPVQALAQLAQLRAGTPIRLTVLDVTLPPLPVALASLPQSTTLDALLPPRAPATPVPQQATQPTGNAASPLTPATPNTPSGTYAPPPVATTTGAPATSTAAAPVTAPAQATPALVQNELAPLQLELQHKATLPSAVRYAPTFDPSPALPRAPDRPAETRAPANPAPLERAVPVPSTTTANQISAHIIGHDADGANILHTPFATLKLYTPQPLPTGTILLVSAEVDNAPPITTPTSAAEEHLASIIPKGDAVIEDVLAWMLTNQPDAARELHQRLPGMQRNLASSLLFFIAALKSGDVGEIVGKRALRLLDSNAPELLARLRQEMGNIQANIADSPLQHWTFYPLSMMVGPEMHHARMYVGKDANENQSSDSPGRGQRFVLEIDLSQLGAMQLDGFVRETEGRKSFDLMVRSAEALEPALTHEVRTIFENSIAVTGLNGQIVFQHGSQHFIRPMADSKPRVGGDGAHTILA
jgi:hypothetical protein